MPGVVAASWTAERADLAERRFEQACRAYERLKGLARSGEDGEGNYRIARFAGPGSACPEVHRHAPGNLLIAVGGWWFRRDAPEHDVATLHALADRYLREPDTAFDQLDGQYLALCVDPARDRLIAAGDRAGMFPHYVADHDGIAWVSTSAMALACVLKPELDIAGIQALLMGSSIRAPHSAFAGIRRLGFGEQVTLSGGEARIDRVWSPFRDPRTYRRIEDAADEGVAITQASCRRVYGRYPKTICDLTAGLDTRLVAALVTGQHLPFLCTVSGATDHIDVVGAHQMAERFDWPIHHIPRPADWGRQRWAFFQRGVQLADGEMAGSGIDGTVRAKQLVRESCDAATGGSGGEFFREFPFEHVLFRRGKTSRLDLAGYAKYRLLTWYRTDLSLFRRDWRDDWTADQIQAMQQVVEPAPDALNTAKLDAIYLWRSSGHFARYLAAAAHLIPSPQPLLTTEVIEFTLGVPSYYRNRAQLIRHMITQANPELAKLPTCWGGSAEPMGLRHPIRTLPYANATARRWLRKLSTVALGKPLFGDPLMITPDPSWDLDFVSVLAEQGLLEIDNLRSACLYDPDGLRQFLTRARDQDFAKFKLLYAVVTVELICRSCEITPTGQEF